MKLEPKAKPIRIRIKIGKEEYSTFESLRENLNLLELYPRLIDGVFIKWLRQIGEHQRAERAEKIKAMCLGTKDEKRNYILLLSLFDKDVEQTMSKCNYSVDSFFANVKLDKLLELHSKHGFSVNWSDIIRLHLQRMKPKERVKEAKRLFRLNLDKDLSSFDSKEWGAVMAQLVEENNEDASTCRELFYYLIDSSSEPEAIAERVHLVMKSFYEHTKAHYPLTKVLTQADLTIGNLSYLFANEILKGLDINWEELFVDCVKAVKKSQGSEEVSATIEEFKRIIGDYLPLWKAFTKCCTKAGIKEAEAYNDEWLILANSKDFDVIMSALKHDIDWFWAVEQRLPGYSNIESDLGKQIIDLMIFLRGLKNNSQTLQPALSDKYLNGIKFLMMIVCKYQPDSYSFAFHSYPAEYKAKLERMKAYDNNFVLYILNHRDDSFYQICERLRVVLKDKLKAARRQL